MGSRRPAIEWRAILEGLARAGYAARGFVYLSIGLIALLAALDVVRRPSGSVGAVAVLAGWPFGQVWLLAVAAGLLAFAGWRALQALFDADREGRSARALAKRVGQGVSGLVYGALSVSVFGLVDRAEDLGEVDQAEVSERSARQGAAEMMSLPFGHWLLTAVGLFVVAIAVANVAKALQPRFGGRLGCGRMTHRWACRIGRVGYLGRGVAFAPLGYTLFRAGLDVRPGMASDLGGALGSLERQPFGAWLLACVGLGLIAFGTFALVEARFRRIDAPDDLAG